MPSAGHNDIVNVVSDWSIITPNSPLTLTLKWPGRLSLDAIGLTIIKTCEYAYRSVSHWKIFPTILLLALKC